jgi:hypothetical protein
MEGTSVGNDVGKGVGKGVGAKEGKSEGTLVAVGACEGSSEGAGEGAHVACLQMNSWIHARVLRTNNQRPMRRVRQRSRRTPHHNTHSGTNGKEHNRDFQPRNA